MQKTGIGDKFRNRLIEVPTKTAEDSFHRTGISLFQHSTKTNRGNEKLVFSGEIIKDKGRIRVYTSIQFHHIIVNLHTKIMHRLQFKQMTLYQFYQNGVTYNLYVGYFEKDWLKRDSK